MFTYGEPLVRTDLKLPAFPRPVYTFVKYTKDGSVIVKDATGESLPPLPAGVFKRLHPDASEKEEQKSTNAPRKPYAFGAAVPLSKA